MKLFNYQSKAISLIKDQILKGHKKIALQMVTGSGKTVVAKEIIKNSVKNGKKVFFILKGNKLMDQTLKVFREFKFGLIWSDKTKNINNNLIFVSAPTYIVNRKKWKPYLSRGDVFIIDEAHDCTAKGYKLLLGDIPEDKIILGLSATFYRKADGKGHTYWDTALEPVSAKELLDMGRIPELDIYHSPIDYNLDKVKINGQDYDRNSLYDVISKSKTLYGKTIFNYNKYNPDKKPTIAFCINIAHCIDISELFKKEGISALIIHSQISKEQKDNFSENLKYSIKNKIPFVICSVDMLSRGVDIPQLEVGLHLSPTLSMIRWRQQVGRLTRKISSDPNVTERVTLIDFTKNYQSLGSPYAPLQPQLTSKDHKIKKKGGEEKTKRCDKCNAINKVFFSHCIVCNVAFAGKKLDVDIIDIELRRATLEERDEKALSLIKQGGYIERSKKYILEKDWKYHNVRKKMGEDVFLLSKNIPEDVKQKYIKETNKL